MDIMLSLCTAGLILADLDLRRYAPKPDEFPNLNAARTPVRPPGVGLTTLPAPTCDLSVVGIAMRATTGWSIGPPDRTSCGGLLIAIMGFPRVHGQAAVLNCRSLIEQAVFFCAPTAKITGMAFALDLGWPGTCAAFPGRMNLFNFMVVIDA